MAALPTLQIQLRDRLNGSARVGDADDAAWIVRGPIDPAVGVQSPRWNMSYSVSVTGAPPDSACLLEWPFRRKDRVAADERYELPVRREKRRAAKARTIRCR